jgi:hypothetical protein
MSYVGDDSQADIRPGVMIFIRVTLTGYKDRSYSMRMQMLDGRGRELFVGDELGIAISTCENLSPRANEDGVSWRCWSQTPAPGTSYRIRAELYDAGPVRDLSHGDITTSQPLLDFMETDQLTVL